MSLVRPNGSPQVSQASATAPSPLIETDPFDAAYYQALASGHARSGRWRQAAEALNRALEMNPSHPATLTALGDAELAQRHYEPAQVAYQRALTFAPNTALAHLGLGRLACERLQFRAGDSHFQRALQSNSRLGRAWFGRVQICRLQQATARAQMFLRAARCLIEDPAQGLWLALAEARLAQDEGDDSAAQRCLETAIGELPVEPPADAHRLFNALADLREASPPDLFDITAVQTHAHAQAALYSQSLALYPPQADYWRRLASAYVRLSDFSQAMACLGKSLEEDPALMACQYDRSQILYWLGDLPAANAALREVIRQAPRWREPYEDLARNLLELGDELGARRAWAAAQASVEAASS